MTGSSTSPSSSRRPPRAPRACHTNWPSPSGPRSCRAGPPTCREPLDTLGVEEERRKALPFERLDVHFARLFVLEDAKDLDGADIAASLVFLSDIDAPLRWYLNRLCEEAGEGLDRAFAYCQGYPSQPTPRARAAYLKAHSVKSATLYVNTVGRSVRQVRQEAELRERIASFLDEQASELAGKTATEVRAAVGEHVGSNPGLRWALRPAALPPLVWRVSQGVEATAAVVAGVGLLPFAIAALPFYLVLLRIHERSDKWVGEKASPARVAELEAREDWITQNQFTVVGLRKAGSFRLFTLRVVLFVLEPADSARLQPGKPRRNRDDSLCPLDTHRRQSAGALCEQLRRESRKLHGRLHRQGGVRAECCLQQRRRIPADHWYLFLDGAHDEQAFKVVLRGYQIVTPVWYSAYPDLTAANLANNAAIRAGLTRALSSEEAAAWAARL